MTDARGNEGIIQVGGGEIKAGVMAVGHGAHASSTGGTWGDVADLAYELIRQIRTAPDLPDRQELISAAQGIAQEAEAEQPDRRAVTERMARLTSGVQVASGLASAVGALASAVSAMV